MTSLTSCVKLSSTSFVSQLVPYSHINNNNENNLISSDFIHISGQCVRCGATQLAVAATSQNELGRTVLMTHCVLITRAATANWVAPQRT